MSCKLEELLLCSKKFGKGCSDVRSTYKISGWKHNQPPALSNTGTVISNKSYNTTLKTHLKVNFAPLSYNNKSIAAREVI
jgi:hypothetical protein